MIVQVFLIDGSCELIDFDKKIMSYIIQVDSSSNLLKNYKIKI